MRVISKWPAIPLAEVIEETQYGTSLKANDRGVGVPVLRMSNITYSGAFDLTDLKHVDLPLEDIERYSVIPGDLLFNRTNSPELVGKMGVWRQREGFAFAGYLVRLRVRPDIVDPTYIAAWFNTPEMKKMLRARAKPSINMSNINATEVLSFPVVLPPMPEQRRIAAVLNRMEKLRTKRRAALAQVDGLTQAIFLEMFGDPVTNPRRWPTIGLAELLAVPLRNGVSPSKSGKVSAKVLTLSAVTGGEFDPAAFKTSTFERQPPEDQSVDDADLLICRGNGNAGLVGRGDFPTSRMRDVTFPDTMIAARVDQERMVARYLENVWNSRAVRRQIGAMARTTNGTFKINQAALERVELMAPPLQLQRTFARRAAAVDRLKAVHRASLAQLDALFASLQHRAFRGEL